MIFRTYWQTGDRGLPIPAVSALAAENGSAALGNEKGKRPMATAVAEFHRVPQPGSQFGDASRALNHFFFAAGLRPQEAFFFSLPVFVSTTAAFHWQSSRPRHANSSLSVLQAGGFGAFVSADTLEKDAASTMTAAALRIPKVALPMGDLQTRRKIAFQIYLKV